MKRCIRDYDAHEYCCQLGDSVKLYLSRLTAVRKVAGSIQNEAFNIRDIQELPMYKNVETIMIYTHLSEYLSTTPALPLGLL